MKSYNNIKSEVTSSFHSLKTKRTNSSRMARIFFTSLIQSNHVMQCHLICLFLFDCFDWFLISYYIYIFFTVRFLLFNCSKAIVWEMPHWKSEDNKLNYEILNWVEELSRCSFIPYSRVSNKRCIKQPLISEDHLPQHAGTHVSTSERWKAALTLVSWLYSVSQVIKMKSTLINNLLSIHKVWNRIKKWNAK